MSATFQREEPFVLFADLAHRKERSPIHNPRNGFPEFPPQESNLD
ncbi:MAG TPA: hypothetical protein VMS76_17380 [Planctomycetota bacterium]|nr:hypothetical protein [Planctomycetota bacterium]